MADLDFYIDIEDSSGAKLGSGPLQSVTGWQYVARMDRAGTIKFDISATDPQAEFVANRNIARAYALLDGTWQEIGAGVIDTIETVPGNEGRVRLSVSGLDLIRELSYRSVHNLQIADYVVPPFGYTHAGALALIEAYAPAGWTFTPAVSPDNDYVYGRFGGESVLAALVWLAEKTQTHFYRAAGRELVFTSQTSDAGVRAIQAFGDLAAETCAITSLARTVDTNGLLTRIYPYGSGQGRARLTLAATSRAAPTGYTLDAANNYIQHTAAHATYGLIDYPNIEFKDIGPVSNSDDDLEAAADMLFDVALEELTRRATLPTQETYTLTIEGCSQLLRPMQTIRLVYRDPDQGIDIDEDLIILEATWEVNTKGVRTSKLVVSTDDRWPESDASAAAERAVQGRLFMALPQLNANSYVMSYSKSVDATYNAEFRFRFGLEVAQLNQVTFEFQILSLEATVAGGASTSSGASSTSSSGASTTSTSGQGGATLNHSHDLEVTLQVASPAGTAVYWDDVVGLNTVTGSSGIETGPGTALRDTDHDHNIEHTHNIDHTHTFTPLLTYGIFRDSGGNTFALSDLEYSVDSSTWYSFTGGVNGYESLGSSWHKVDLTELLWDSTTLRPLNANNTLVIRKKAAAANKKATIDAQLSVRNTIQAVVYA